MTNANTPPVSTHASSGGNPAQPAEGVGSQPSPAEESSPEALIRQVESESTDQASAHVDESEADGAIRESKPTGTTGENGLLLEAHPLAELFPIMSEEDFEVYKEDVRHHQDLEPVWTYEGKILDGRHLYRACKKLGREVIQREWNGENGSPLQFVLSRNLHRRHLTSSQRAAVAVSVLPQLEDQARQRQLTQGNRGQEGGRGRKKPLPKDLGNGASKHDGEAAAMAAKLMGSNRQYVSDAARLEKSHPDLFAQVFHGTMTLPMAVREARQVKAKAERKIRQKASRDKRQQARKEAREKHKEPRDVSELLDKAKDFDELAKDLNKFRQKYNKLKNTSVGTFLVYCTSEFAAIKRAINDAKPKNRCYSCNGHGCSICKDTGIRTRKTF